MQPINDTLQTPVLESKRNGRTRRTRRPEVRVQRRALYCAPWFTTLLLSGNTQAQVPASASQTQEGQDKPDGKKTETRDPESEAAYQREREEAWRRSKRMIDRREEMKLRAETERAVRDYEDAKRQRIEAEERAKSNGDPKSSTRRLTDARILFPDLAFAGFAAGSSLAGAGPISFEISNQEADRYRKSWHSVGLRVGLDKVFRNRMTFGGAVGFSLRSYEDEYVDSGSSVSRRKGGDGLLVVSPRLGYLAPIADEVYLWPRLSLAGTIGAVTSNMNGSAERYFAGMLDATVDCGVLFAVSKHLFISVTPSVSFSILEGNVERQSLNFGTRAGLGLAF